MLAIPFGVVRRELLTGFEPASEDRVQSSVSYARNPTFIDVRE